MRKKSIASLRTNIPNKIKTGIKKFFDVLWSDGLSDTKGKFLYGKTEFEPNKIIINADQADKDAVLTFFHECIHAIDHDHEIGLTEDQVIKLEKCFPYFREIILVLEGKK